MIVYGMWEDKWMKLLWWISIDGRLRALDCALAYRRVADSIGRSNRTGNHETRTAGCPHAIVAGIRLNKRETIMAFLDR